MRVAAVILLILLLRMPGLAAPADDLAGTWQGVIQFPDIKLRMRFHFTREPAGGFKAALDSVDQGARGIPVDSVELDGRTLNVVIKAVNGDYQGELNESGVYITGQWRHGTQPAVPLNLEKQEGSAADQPATLSPAERTAALEAGRKFCGVWEGALEINQTTNHLKIKVWRAANGMAKGALDCYEKQIVNLPLKDVSLQDGELRFETPGLGASFKGTFREPAVVAGEWRQAANVTELLLNKAPPPSSIK